MPAVELIVPSITLIWCLVAVFIFLTLLVSSIARLRWTRHLTADEVYRISNQSTNQSINQDNAVFADLVTSVKAMKSSAADLFKAQSIDVSSRFDRLTAENEQIKALLSIKNNDERGLVQAALELVMNECAAAQAYRVRQKRREAQVRHAAEATKSALSINQSSRFNQSINQSPRLRESINRLTRECTNAASESAREVDRKYRIRNHASIIGNDAMNILESNLEAEINAERRFHSLLTSSLVDIDHYTFQVMESELERDDTIRLAEERRQSNLTVQAKQQHDRRVTQASEVLNQSINRLLTMLDSCINELNTARSNRCEDEKSTIRLIEDQRFDAESRYESGLLAGFDSELKQGIIQLIRHADGLLHNQSINQSINRSRARGLTVGNQSINESPSETESLANRLIRALGDSQGFESISQSITDIGITCSGSLIELPATDWLTELESALSSGSQILSSYSQSEREHVDLVLNMHRPADLNDREEQRLNTAEQSLNTAEDQLMSDREKLLNDSYQAHQKSIQSIVSDLNDAETLRLQHISRIQNRIDSLEQNASKGSLSSAELEEDAQRMISLKSEQSNAELELADVRKQAQQSIIDAHAKWAASSRTAMQKASDRHKQMIAKAFSAYVTERSSIADRQRGVAAQADMEARDAICDKLRDIQTSELSDADKLQEAAVKRYHADALVNLTREHREQTRLAKEELEQQRSNELDAVKQQHDATIQSIREALQREVDTMKSQISDEVQRGAKEQELTKQSSKAEREAVSAHKKQVKSINEDWNKRIDTELKSMFDEQASERSQELSDQREELSQFRNSARAKLEMALLIESLNESNRDRAKPLIEATVSSRHEDVKAQLEARQKRETVDRLREALVDTAKARARSVADLQRAREAGGITMDKFAQSLADIDREFDPARTAKDIRAQLLVETASELKRLREGQADEVRTIMSQIYPDEDFSGAEWQNIDTSALDELVASHLQKQKQDDDDAIAQVQQQRQAELERQHQLSELIAQLESDCEARINNDVAELHALRNAKLEDLDGTHWVAMQDLQDRLQNAQLTQDEFDDAVAREQDAAHSKAAAITAQCQAAVVAKSEAHRRACRQQQAALQSAPELPAVSAMAVEQQERDVKVNALLRETADALVARGRGVAQCRQAGINKAIAIMSNIMRNLPIKEVQSLSTPSINQSSNEPNVAVVSSLDRIEALLKGGKRPSHTDKCVTVINSPPPVVIILGKLSSAQQAAHALVQRYINECVREFGVSNVRFGCVDDADKVVHFYSSHRLLVASKHDLLHTSTLLTRVARAMCVITLSNNVSQMNVDVHLDRAITTMAQLVSVSPAINDTSDEGSDDEWTEQQTIFLQRISTRVHV